MVRVTIEIWPGGDKGERSTLGSIDIALAGKQADAAIGRYDVTLYKHSPYFSTGGVYKSGIIDRFPRARDGGPNDLRAGGPYDLTYWALHACGYEDRRKALLASAERQLLR